MLCHNCDTRVMTETSTENTYYTYLAAALLILIFNVWSIVLLPFAIPLTRAIVRKCSKCETRLEVKTPMGLPSLKDEVLTLRCGECAVVLSRSYLASMLGVITMLILLIWMASIPVPVHSNQYLRRVYLNHLGRIRKRLWS